MRDSNLQRDGWKVIDGNRNDDSLLDIARSFGQPVPLKNGEFIRRSRPICKDKAAAGTFASVYGTTSYPLHTDTAFWPTPARYVLLSVSGDLRRTTLLCSWESVLRTLSRTQFDHLRSSIWHVAVTTRAFLCTLRFVVSKNFGYRFDPLCMNAANTAAKKTQRVLQERLQNVDLVTCDWRKNSILVIDNWKMLHGRGPVPQHEGERVLSRVYVNSTS